MTMPVRPLTPNPHVGKVLCAHCRTWRDPGDVQAVQRIATGVVRYLCRRETSPRWMRHGVCRVDVEGLLSEEHQP
jgi:hypothetical protein